jgi:hypothetical protein
MTAINVLLRVVRQNACHYFCAELDIGWCRPQFLGGNSLERVPLCKRWGFAMSLKMRFTISRIGRRLAKIVDIAAASLPMAGV